MAIHYEQKNRIFTLQTAHTAYQMKVDAYGFLLHLHYGGWAEGNMDYLLANYERGFCSNPADARKDRSYSLDVLPQEYPAFGMGDYRSSALVLRNADESECCDLRYASHSIYKGKYALKGLPAVYAQEDEAETLEIMLEDAANGVHVRLLYGVLEDDDVITRSAVICNQGNGKVVVEKAASACLDFLHGDYEMVSFYGRHAMERNFQRTEIRHGNYSIGSRRTASSHQYNPGVVVAQKGASEDAGSCYGLLFVYSGNFLCEAEKDQLNQTRILMGLQSDLFHYPLGPGEELYIPETVLSYSATGFAKLSNQFHHCIRRHICRGRYTHQPRPVLVNSWEASYFSFDGEAIYRLAGQAAALGLDLVVMDDGWFGKRENDHSSLGDWQANEEKLGCTLGELASRINKLGLKFGIWIEPEMVSEDSRLYREHPDWALQIPGRSPVYCRDQLVLDFSRPDVRDSIFEQVCAVLDQGNIEYVKWDMNRSLSDLYSQAPGSFPGKLSYDYVAGVYDFLERLLERYPYLFIEGCSGGGGRFDAGMLYYTPQIWCSDNTDAADRIRIQYGTSFFYPASTVGSHVSAVPNHQTGRSISLHTRGIVAMAGTFGYELDFGTLGDAQKEEIRRQVAQYKKFADLIQHGYYYRLSNPFEDGYGAWMFVSKNKKHVLVNVVLLEVHGNMTVTYVRLKGLSPHAVYADAATGTCYYGSALMEAGIPMPVEKEEYAAYQIELRKC